MIASRASTAARTAALALLLAAALAPGDARAQSKSDAFAGKIPPVSGQLFRKAGRLELTLVGDLSLNDAFYSKYFGGAKLGYHLTESFSVAAHLSTGTAVRTGSAVTCRANGGCEDATDEQLFQVPGRITMLTGLELAWAPVYGKLNVASERVAHFDLSILAGADLVSHEAVVSRDQAQELAAAGSRPGTERTVGGHVGLGARIFLAEWIALRLEVKDYVYVVEVPNDQQSGSPRKDVQNQLFTELGVSFFLPFSNRPVR